MKRMLALGLLILLSAWPAQAGTRPPVGGGILHAGFHAEYFDNPDLKGEPRFVRKDLRVRFDWGELLPILGTNAENLRDFPRDGFSVRWTGQVMVRFDESFTFLVNADDGARLLLKPADGKEWIALTDQWDKAGTVSSKPVAMKANVPYDLKLEYHDLKGAAATELRWSSPSTPEELVDTPSVPNIAYITYYPVMMADAFKSVSAWGGKDWKTPDNQPLAEDQREPSGWPKCDAQTRTGFVADGRHRLRFDGLAEVRIKAIMPGTSGKFVVAGKEYGATLPSGIGYDAKTNRTTADILWTGAGTVDISFLQTQRNAQAAKGTGITGVVLMRPVEIGGDEVYPFGKMVNNAAQRLLENYVQLREYSGIAGATWDERSRPGDHDQFRGKRGETGGALENYILVANETGRDLYLNVNYPNPPDDYLRKVALALQFGTDGKEPYTKATANPAYPPLNSNLRVYLEFKNEVWNYGGVAPSVEAAAAQNTAEWQIVNYDDKLAGQTTGWFASQRWQALQTVRISKAFRAVLGDAAMGERFRPLLFGQYDRVEIWSPLVGLIDNYFNNADGHQHVPDPHPVNYYVWGGGGALYYGSDDPTGSKGIDWLKGGDFEQPRAPAGQPALRPAGTAWEFAGPAGVANTHLPVKHLADKYVAAGQAAVPAGTLVGCQFTVGPKDLYVYEVGGYRGAAKGKTGGLVANLYDSAGKNLTADAGTAAGAGERPEFNYRALRFTNAAAMRDPRPMRLKAGETYYLLAATAAEACGDDTQITPPHGLSLQGAVTAQFDKQSASGMKITRPGNFAFGPVDLVFTDEPVAADGAAVGVPPWKAPDGEQSLFLGVSGKVSQTVTFPQPGQYALSFKMAGSANLPSARLVARLDEKTIAEGKSAAPQAFQESSTEVFEIAQAGPHRVELEAVGKAGEPGLFIDRLRVSSVDAMFGGLELTNIPGSGDADGEVKRPWAERSLVQVNEALSWGLVPSSYEGGWAVGGDRGRTPFMNYCNFVAPKAAKAEARAMDTWTRLGGYEFQRHYQQIPGEYNAQQIVNFWHAVDYPLPRGVIEYANRLPALPDNNGVAVPATLTPEQATMAGTPATATRKIVSGKLAPYCWLTWNILVPKTTEYIVTVEATGEKPRVFLDESQEVTGKVRLTTGLHTIKVRALAGACAVSAVQVR